MNRIKKYFFITLIILFLLIPSISLAEAGYTGELVTEVSGEDLILSIFDGTKKRELFLIKNFKEPLSDLNIKKNFTDEKNYLKDYDPGILKLESIPHLDLYAPMEIIALEENLWFETLIFDEVSKDKYEYTGFYYFLDGVSNYEVYKGEKPETLTVKTGEEPELIKNLKDKNIKFKYINSPAGGKIISKEGRLKVGDKITKHSNFLLTGVIRGENIKIPPIFLTYDFSYASEFKDVKRNNWYYRDLKSLVEKGVISGYGDNTFKPNNNITFGEFLKLALVSTSEEEFIEEPGKDWAKVYYDYAIDTGIFTTLDFKGDYESLSSPLYREDMAFILTRVEERINRKALNRAYNLDKVFKDFHEISPHRRDSISKAYGSKYISGYDNKFHPKGYTTRAQTFKVINDLIERNK